MKIIDADKLLEKLRECNHIVMTSPMFDINLILNELPSVTSWIPVSERLPDYDGYDEIIATVDGEHCRVQYINAVVTDIDCEDGEWYLYGLKTENLKVLAWQPLPEPWRGETK